MVEELRKGGTVSVKSIKEARALLNAMIEIKPPNLTQLNPEFPDPRGTYRGDLINIKDPTSKYVHDLDKVEKT